MALKQRRDAAAVSWARRHVQEQVTLP